MTGTVLLTGATGFVGRQILRALTERSARVRLIVREGAPTRASVPDGVESIITTPDLFGERADWWAEVLRDIDTVIHAAWYTEPGKYLQSEKNLDCLAGTLQLARGAAKAKVRRLVGIGTCSEYDCSGGKVSVTTPLRPSTPYAGAKAATFMALSQWLPQQGVEFAWCRLFYLYGEGEDARRLVPHLRARLKAGVAAELTSGNQIRDFLDVREAGQRTVEVALGGESGPVNICSGIPISVRQLAEQIADEYGRRDLLKFGARPDNQFDPPYVVGVRNEVLP